MPPRDRELQLVHAMIAQQNLRTGVARRAADEARVVADSALDTAEAALPTVDYTAADVLTKLLTVDGPGSGLDADTLDSHDTPYFLDRGNHTGAQAISTVTGLQDALDAKLDDSQASAFGLSFLGTATLGDAKTLIGLFTSSLSGLAPASGGGTANYLRADGTWAAPPGTLGGTVTTVSVVTANGVSGSVANASSTPAITLTLGAITPSLVNSSGTVKAFNTSGANFRAYGATPLIELYNATETTRYAYIFYSGLALQFDNELGTAIQFRTGGVVRTTITDSGITTAGNIAASGAIAGLTVEGSNINIAGDTIGNSATTTKLTTARTIGISGDGTWSSGAFDGSANVTAVLTLATVNAGAGTYGDASHVAQVTVNGKGLATTAANVLITPAAIGAVALSALDTDTTLAANSDAKLATQKAVKTYVDNSVAGLFDFKGDFDASASPNYPAASKADAYHISVAGKIGSAGGKSVDIGDLVVAKADNAGGTEASVGTSWYVVEHNLVGALIAANNLSDITNAATARSNLGLAAVAASGSASDLSAGTVPAARMPALTGDVTTVAGAVATTLATVNSNVGSFGSATQVATFTVNGKGLTTAAANVTITPAFSSITGKPTTLSGYGITDAQALDSDLTTIASLTATTDNFIVSVASAWASRTPTQVRTTLGLGTGDSPQFTGLSIIGTAAAPDATLSNYDIVARSTSTAAINVGPSIALAGESGNGVTPYLFAGIHGAKGSSTAGDYSGYGRGLASNAAGTIIEAFRWDATGILPLSTTTASAANVFQSGSGTVLLRSTSARRYKRDIENADPALASNVLKLRPIWYRSKAEADNPEWGWWGLVAEEVAKVDPRLVHWAYQDRDYFMRRGARHLRKNAKLRPDGVQYERLSVLLLSVIQRMDKRLAKLEAINGS